MLEASEKPRLPASICEDIPSDSSYFRTPVKAA